MSATSSAAGSTLLPAPMEEITGTPAFFAFSMIASFPLTVSMASTT